MKKILIFLFFILILFSFISISSAHEANEENEKKYMGERIDDFFRKSSGNLAIISSIIITLLVYISIKIKKTEKIKYTLFILISLIIILTTIYLSGTTIYLNIISETGGPVHWHSDFEIWNCGEEVNLISPTGLTNKVGNPVLHEHNDNRVHVEGVLLEKKHADLHSFFEVIGGSLTSERLTVPTDNGIIDMENKDKCKEKEGKLQAFLLKVKNPSALKKDGFIFEQTKLENFENYILSPYAYVPPGDCIIIEFDIEKDKTDKICESYTVAIERGDLKEE